MLTAFRRLPRSKKALTLTAIAAFVIFGLSGGCAAHRRPPALTSAERELLREAPLPYSVTVALWDDQTSTGQNPEAYASALAALVDASGTFKTSRYEHGAAPVGQELVATSTGAHCDSAVIPLLSIVTLGIVPTIFQDEHCEGMLLRRAAGQQKESGVQVEVHAQATSVLGWGAILVGALPGWSYGPVGDDSRFAERFRLAVVQRRADIDHLVQH